MSKRLLLVLTAGLLALGGAALQACDDGGDGDADGDTDADADEGGDADGDSDADERTPECGDGTCDRTETARNCPGDCPAECGDGACTHEESPSACPEDCVTDDCDVVADTGCEAGEKCAMYTRDEGLRWEIGCVPFDAGSAAGPGEECTGLEDAYFGQYDNCVGGYWCQDVGRGYRCEKICNQEDRGACSAAYPDAEGDMTVDGLCLVSYGPDMPVAGLMVCKLADGCSPVCQDCEGGGPGGRVGCYPATDGINVGAICAGFTRDDTAEGITGDACASLNNCAAGYQCVRPTSGAERECRPTCDPNAAYPGSDGDADADADAGDADAGDAGADADADADVEVCPFAYCEERVGEGAGTCQFPEGYPAEMFGTEAGVGVCIE